ncbi:MAG: MarR family winged helix-turn-helix transcriptional regulator [Actinomycetota bacterium]
MTSAASASSDEPRWLDDDEMRVWRGFLEATERVNQAITDGLKDADNLTLDDYEVLVHLSEAPGRRLRMSELSDRLLHSQSRLTQRVDRLGARGYVCREKCPEDRRGTFACLTDEGFAALEAAAPFHLRDVRAALIDQVEPEELRVLATVFERVAERLREPAG